MTRISERIAIGLKKGRKRFSFETKDRIASVAKRAAQFYRERGRSFPWRIERDPFSLAVVEILLQKTRADSVVAAHREMLRLYPSARELANADVGRLEDMLRPLGLSRKRSAQLIGMASVVAERGASVLEDWKGVLRDVPGLGAYASRAIACFANGQSVGIVDANVARIERRVFRLRQKDSRAVVFQQYADEIARSSDDVIATNFGLLDLGALVCLPAPKCTICPLDTICAKFGVPPNRERTVSGAPTVKKRGRV